MLRQDLDAERVDLKIVSGQPAGDQARRGDAAALDWGTTVATRTISFRGHALSLTNTVAEWKDSSAVILPLMGTSADVYRALWRARRSGLRVGLWGHVKNYVAPPNRIDVSAERCQMLRAHHVFAYVPSGAEYAKSVGVAAGGITTLFNTVDLATLRNEMSSLSAGDVDDFRKQHGLGRDVLAYIGGLDASKRIDFLSAVLEELWAVSPDTRILIGGKGENAGLLGAAVARGQAVMMGYVGDREKALIGRVARALVVPGRIGLVAVEALELRLPVFTTTFPFHGPEREYLVEGRDVFTLADDTAAFAAALLRDGPAASSTTRPPELDEMSARFTEGILRMIYT
jgi:glycosyltransferase involved in cell wall biosynthesis